MPVILALIVLTAGQLARVRALLPVTLITAKVGRRVTVLTILLTDRWTTATADFSDLADDPMPMDVTLAVTHAGFGAIEAMY